MGEDSGAGEFKCSVARSVSYLKYILVNLKLTGVLYFLFEVQIGHLVNFNHPPAGRHYPGKPGGRVRDGAEAVWAGAWRGTSFVIHCQESPQSFLRTLQRPIDLPGGSQGPLDSG